MTQSENDLWWKTNVPEVTGKLSEEILTSIKSLESAIKDLKKAVIDRGPREAIPYAWIENATPHFESIKNNVGRINGAVLVRATKC